MWTGRRRDGDRRLVDRVHTRGAARPRRVVAGRAGRARLPTASRSCDARSGHACSTPRRARCAPAVIGDDGKTMARPVAELLQIVAGPAVCVDLHLWARRGAARHRIAAVSRVSILQTEDDGIERFTPFATVDLLAWIATLTALDGEPAPPGEATPGTRLELEERLGPIDRFVAVRVEDRRRRGRIDGVEVGWGRRPPRSLDVARGGEPAVGRRRRLRRREAERHADGGRGIARCDGGGDPEPACGTARRARRAARRAARLRGGATATRSASSRRSSPCCAPRRGSRARTTSTSRHCGRASKSEFRVTGDGPDVFKE